MTAPFVPPARELESALAAARVYVCATPMLNRLHRRDEVRWRISTPEGLSAEFGSLAAALELAARYSKWTGYAVSVVDAMGLERERFPARTPPAAPGPATGGTT